MNRGIRSVSRWSLSAGRKHDPFRFLALALATALAAALAPTATAQPAVDTSSDEMIQLDFNDVELSVVIDTIARLTNTNFIYDDRVRGRVTIISPSPVSVDQAFAVFESVLKVKGFTAIGGPAGVMKIIPIRDAKESSIETVKDSRPPENRDKYITRLIPLRYISAEDITNTIKPLVSKDASMVAYGPTNTIILTDSDSNIKRLFDILEAIDVETYKEELAVIKVQHADAGTLAEQISEIYEADTPTSRPTRRQRSAPLRRSRPLSAVACASSPTTVRTRCWCWRHAASSPTSAGWYASSTSRCEARAASTSTTCATPMPRSSPLRSTRCAMASSPDPCACNRIQRAA